MGLETPRAKSISQMFFPPPPRHLYFLENSPGVSESIVPA